MPDSPPFPRKWGRRGGLPQLLRRRVPWALLMVYTVCFWSPSCSTKIRHAFVTDSGPMSSRALSFREHFGGNTRAYARTRSTRHRLAGGSNVGPFRSGLGTDGPEIFDGTKMRKELQQQKSKEAQKLHERLGRFTKDPERWYGANFSTTIDPKDRIERHYDKWEAVAQEISTEINSDEDDPKDYMDEGEEEEEEEDNEADEDEDEEARDGSCASGFKEAEEDKTVGVENSIPPPPASILPKFPDMLQDVGKGGVEIEREGEGNDSDAPGPDKVYLEDRDKAVREIGLEQPPQHDPEFEKWLQTHPNKDAFAESIAKEILKQNEDIEEPEVYKARIDRAEAKEAAIREAREALRARVKAGKQAHIDSWKEKQENG